VTANQVTKQLITFAVKNGEITEMLRQLHSNTFTLSTQSNYITKTTNTTTQTIFTANSK